jgi:phosphopantothenoylcysteine decarboxylase/phosphopantothenate--cysteine ligase
MNKKNIIFGLTGSIACYKACSVISKLVQYGCDVQTVCTKNALNFIGKATLEGLTKKKVLIDMFERESYTKHVELAKWADIFVICPATANIMNKFAYGISDDYLSTIFLSWRIKEKPVLVFPAMNENMYEHPVTQKSIEILKETGAVVLETGFGNLACGDKGKGRLLEPENIMEIIKKYL